MSGVQTERVRSAMAGVDAFVTRWWFSHVLLLGMCGGILLAATVMTPSDHMLHLFGQEIPVMCGFRKIFGIPCPGCGMTRSFVFLAHGHVVDAFRMNLLGPPLFAFVAAQVPYQAWRLYRGLSRAVPGAGRA